LDFQACFGHILLEIFNSSYKLKDLVLYNIKYRILFVNS